MTRDLELEVDPTNYILLQEASLPGIISKKALVLYLNIYIYYNVLTDGQIYISLIHTLIRLYISIP